MGKSAVIICNGQFPRKEYPKYLIRTADYIICCDGAYEKFLKHSSTLFCEGRTADVVIGDMDSIPGKLKKSFKGLLIADTDQETNDQTKAFSYTISNFKDISEIHILGATGEREDHTIGNLSLLMEYARTYDLPGLGINVDMVSDHMTAFAITDTAELHCGKGRTVSLFSPDNGLRIRSHGLVWKTDDVVFDNWWKCTLNKACEDVVKLEFSHPSIALVMLD